MSDYSISIYKSRITFPLCGAVHTWVVLESPEYGTNRYEIHVWKNKDTNNYFYINNQPPEEGMNIFAFFDKWYSSYKFKAQALYSKRDLALRDQVLFLEKEITTYPHKNVYSLFPGPNSNSFTQWVIQEARLAERVELPWNAFGKSYYKKNNK